MEGLGVLKDSSYLIVPLAGWVVQVEVAPVIVDPLLRLLVHPVQLVGAAQHVVAQTQQVSLASAGAGLDQTGTHLEGSGSARVGESTDASVSQAESYSC